MLLRLEVRLRDHPGSLPWGAVLTRWVGQNPLLVVLAATAALPVPSGGTVLAAGLVVLLLAAYGWADILWPLWDGRRQALHDKLARTCVVRRGS